MLNSIKNRSDLLLGCVLAFFSMLLINLPLFTAIVTTDELSYPDIVYENSDESFYMARVQEVFNGYSSAGQPFIYEHREEKYPFRNLEEKILGGVMRLFNWKIKTVMILGDVLFPFLLVLLFWLAVKEILPSRMWRTLLVVTFFLTTYMFVWRRPVIPQMTFIWPFLYYYAFLTQRNNRLSFCAVRGVLVGLMFYSYPYQWTYCLSVEGLLILSRLRSTSLHDQLKMFAAFAVPFFITIFPWGLTMIAMQGNPLYEDLVSRSGFVDSHWPTGPFIQLKIALTLSFLLFTIRIRGWKREQLPILLLLFAGFIVYNQTLITGKELEFSSHYSRIVRFGIWIAVFYSASQLLPLTHRIAKPIIGSICVVLIFSVVSGVQQGFANFIPPEKEERNELRIIITTLNELPNEQVIVANELMSHHIPVYSSHYPFFSASANLHMVETSELLKRARAQQFIFPHEIVEPRDVFSFTHVNQALHRKQVCKLKTLLEFSHKEGCEFDPKDYLPVEWDPATLFPPFTGDELVSFLQERYARYLLLDVPPPHILLPHLTKTKEFGKYSLWELSS
jgi:hypothetical protein